MLGLSGDQAHAEAILDASQRDLFIAKDASSTLIT